VRAIQDGDSKIDIRKKIFAIIIQMLSIVFINAALIFTMQKNFPSAFAITIGYAEDGVPEFTFDISLYFVIITVTTVGYGDVYPSSTFSRMWMAISFIASFVAFTIYISDI
jgi:hypothetical protein